ncbi:hypothetical protein PAL_GLEAN10004754 [Pteropus alecto]|uniref:Uncharacterized protein n=1 Tax=Pteropus alecto TaxID=9402 RepID=L5KC36_PTEAL|nr:hypothetical protein PAL_GLEAN10004754 [Pteropus alecto]
MSTVASSYADRSSLVTEEATSPLDMGLEMQPGQKTGSSNSLAHGSSYTCHTHDPQDCGPRYALPCNVV